MVHYGDTYMSRVSLTLARLSAQWVSPLLQNAMAYMHEGKYNYLGILERVLKLAVPNLAIWMLLFLYACHSTSGPWASKPLLIRPPLSRGFFHSFLNITAELCRFGDRQFYKDWYGHLLIVPS